jgi:hypothetical protein
MIEVDVILDFPFNKANFLKLKKAVDYINRTEYIDVKLNDDLSVNVKSESHDDYISVILSLWEILIN